MRSQLHFRSLFVLTLTLAGLALPSVTPRAAQRSPRSAAHEPRWDATLVRTQGGWLFGPTPVWTDGSGTDHFHALSRPMESAGFNSARVSIEMSSSTGDCKMRPAIRYSTDAVAWDPDKPILTAYTDTNRVDPGTTYVDLLNLAGTTPKTWFQFGVEVKNKTGSDIALCTATLLVEWKER